MIYFISEDGDVFAYENYQDRDQYGRPDLTEMSQAEIDEYLNPYVPPQIPASVTMRQARLALHSAGLLGDVEAAIDALPEPPKTSARIEWDYSSEVFRNKPFVVMLGQALGLTDEQIDELFITAATL